jgi:hypothetical protein
LKDLRRQRDQDMSVLDMKIEEMHKASGVAVYDTNNDDSLTGSQKFRARVEEREREAEVEKERLYKVSAIPQSKSPVTNGTRSQAIE